MRLAPRFGPIIKGASANTRLFFSYPIPLPMSQYKLTHLELLETEAIHVMREVAYKWD